MTTQTAPATTDSRPIRLVSRFAGLQVRVKKGTAERIPGTDRYETTPGSWIEFARHQAVIRPDRFVRLWGSREAAIEWIKNHTRYSHDFWLNDDKDSVRAKPAPRAATDTE